MFRQFRSLEQGELIVIGGDCSQGGLDSNWCQFMSKTKLDIPLVFEMRGVAADMTAQLYPILNKIFDITKVVPVIALERNNGGASEMTRLDVLNNQNHKYYCWRMPVFGDKDQLKATPKLGWDTSTLTRPIMLAEWKQAFDNHLIQIYDEETIKQHKTFVVNSQGKPEAASGKHDDAVFACAVAWQVYQRSLVVKPGEFTGGVPYERRPFGVYSLDAYK